LPRSAAGLVGDSRKRRDHETIHALRMLDGKKQSDHGPVGGTTNVKALQPQLIGQQANEFHGPLGAVHTLRIGTGQSIRRVVETDHPKVTGEFRDPRIPHVQAAEMTVQQQ